MLELSWERFEAIKSEFNMLLLEMKDCFATWNASSAVYTSFKTGGKIAVVVFPSTENQIITLLRFIWNNNLPFLIIGNGSNTLIRDGGFPGVVIVIKENLADVKLNDAILTAQSGATMYKVAMISSQAGFAGLEFAVDIPGTIGGGLFMNAGMYNETIGSLVTVVKIISVKSQKISQILKDDCYFNYRYSRFQVEQELIVSAKFQLHKTSPEKLKLRIDKIIQERKQKFPLDFPNAGSIFKRPKGNYAGALIEKAGLKGKQIGGAAVSMKHANFIINKENASAEDIEHLIEFIKDKIQKKFSILLKQELRIYGLRK